MKDLNYYTRLKKKGTRLLKVGSVGIGLALIYGTGLQFTAPDDSNLRSLESNNYYLKDSLSHYSALRIPNPSLEKLIDENSGRIENIKTSPEFVSHNNKDDYMLLAFVGSLSLFLSGIFIYDKADKKIKELNNFEENV